MPTAHIEPRGLLKRAREQLSKRAAATTRALFAQGPSPMSETLSHRGDPGMFGPGAVSWRVYGDASSFLGAIRALLIQALHPEVVAGVIDHSRYREDPLGRLAHTAAYVVATNFGAMPEVEAAIAMVRRRHRPVRGTSHRGRPYSADHPAMAAWVHNVLTESFLAAYQAYGRARLEPAEEDRFVAEQARIGALLDADPMPRTASALRRWIAEHPAIAASPGLIQAVDFLRTPPLPRVVMPAYRLLFMGAVASIPAHLRTLLGVRQLPGGRLIGRAAVSGLHLTLGPSPAWQLALARVDAPAPVRFRESLSTVAARIQSRSVRGH